MKDFLEFITENNDYKDFYTIIVKNTLKEIESRLDPDLLDNIKIYTYLYHNVIVVSDIGYLTTIRKNLDVVSENMGEINPKYKEYMFSLVAPRIYDLTRKNRIKHFLENFNHPALEINSYEKKDVDHQIIYNVYVKTLDTKENVLKYMNDALQGLKRTDLVTFL